MEMGMGIGPWNGIGMGIVIEEGMGMGRSGN